MEKTAVFSDYMKNPDAFGSLLFKHLLKELGDSFVGWEVDTIIITLKDKYPGIPDINIDKILSLVALANSFNGQLCFFNEMNCFRHTVNALNGNSPNYEFLGALIPEHAHWAIYEVSQLYPDYHLSTEPAHFMCLCYKHIGQLVLPEDLSEYQDILDSLNQNKELVPLVKKKWEESKDHPVEHLDSEGILEWQILLLKSDQQYMDWKKKVYLFDSEFFESSSS